MDPDTRVASEQSTWSDIGLAATQLLLACSQNGGLSGGWIRTGDNDHLKVTVGNLFGHGADGEGGELGAANVMDVLA